MVGVGGLVLNPQTKKVLLVQEKTARVKIWKFPGGYAEPGEDIFTTSIREVEEETGIKCRFRSLVTFRHRHRGAYGCSDLYFVCLLEPENLDSHPISHCQQEIEDCQWFSLEEAEKVLCGFNSFVFARFLEQYGSLLQLDLSKFGQADDSGVVHGEGKSLGCTIASKVIMAKYKHLEFEEFVYTVDKV